MLVNRRWREFAAANGLREPGAGVGQNYLDICDTVGGEGEADARAVRDGLSAILSLEREEFSWEYSCRSVQGARWFKMIASAFHSREVAGALVMHIDITERKLAEMALEDNDRQLRLLIDALPVGIAYLDRERRYRLTNRCYEDWSGVPARGLPGLAGAGGIGIDAAAADPYVGAALAGTAVRYEAAAAHPERQDRIVATQFIPHRLTSGTVAGSYVLTQDITEQKRIEVALRLAKEEAERANSAKSRFLAAASHDLRQPLQSAMLFTGLLEIKARDPRLQELIGSIGRSLSSMNEMLSALLDMSRLDAGIVDPELRDFPIQSLLDQLAAEFRPLAAEAGLGFRCIASGAAVHSDYRILERILRNLLSNAVRYTERGRILLGCRPGPEEVRVQVWDTGIGIAPDQTEAIFEEYYQTGNPSHDHRKGFGLGLAIVRRLAGLLGIRVELRSMVGRGSLFEVTVPRPRRQEAVRHPPARAPLSAGTGAGTGAGKSVGRSAEDGAGTGAGPGAGLVAVIDDDRLLLEALRLILQAADYEVAAAPCLQEALDALHGLGRAPDIILADYRLADGRTGNDAVQQLRSAFGRAIPGILLTGDTSPERALDARNAGLHLLHKPIRPHTLVETIRRLLPPGGAARAGADGGGADGPGAG